MTQPNAPVTAEIKKLLHELRRGTDYVDTEKLLATFVAEQERLARLDEARWWQHLIMHGPEKFAAEGQGRIAELESAGTEKAHGEACLCEKCQHIGESESAGTERSEKS